MKYPTAEQMEKANSNSFRQDFADRYGHDTRLHKSIDDWVSAGNPSDPEGTMRFGVNLKASHHLALQMASQERKLKMVEMLEQMIEQLPEYQRIYGEQS